MKKCQKCNFENTDTMRFCVECGAPLADAPFVVNVGGGGQQSGVNTAEYGQSTGTQAQGKGAFQGNFPNNFSNVPPPKKSSKKAFLIIGGIAALFLLIFAGVAAIIGYNMFIKDDIVDKRTPTPTLKDSPTPTGTKTPSPTKTPDDDSPTPSITGDSEAEIDRVWVDYDVTENGKKGMRVHVKFTVHKLKGIDSYLAIFFAKENDDKLYTNNKTYRAKDGQVAAYFDMKPGFDDAIYEDAKLFMPYEEFNLEKGKYDLKMDIDVIYKNGDMYKHLQYYDFTFTQN
jgi:zinc-ribbon domain